jgi:hypothetical protein
MHATLELCRKMSINNHPVFPTKLTISSLYADTIVADPDPLVRGMDLDPDPFLIKQKQ